MSYVFNPFTGNFDSDSGAGSSITPVTEFRTITSGEATAKQLTLGATPTAANVVLVDVIGGTAQEFSVDYTISVNILSWSTLALDGVLAAGDKLRIHYYT